MRLSVYLCVVVARHQPCVIHLEYKAPDQSQVKEHLYYVGKGITYDTGGADIKHSGAMVGMSRDKGGAAAILGLFAVVAKMQPRGVNVTAALAMVRNSVGSDAYVSDEIIKARSGCRVRVGNTDAEGRMVMADLLSTSESSLQRLYLHQFYVCSADEGKSIAKRRSKQVIHLRHPHGTLDQGVRSLRHHHGQRSRSGPKRLPGDPICRPHVWRSLRGVFVAPGGL